MESIILFAIFSLTLVSIVAMATHNNDTAKKALDGLVRVVRDLVGKIGQS